METLGTIERKFGVGSWNKMLETVYSENMFNYAKRVSGDADIGKSFGAKKYLRVIFGDKDDVWLDLALDVLVSEIDALINKAIKSNLTYKEAIKQIGIKAFAEQATNASLEEIIDGIIFPSRTRTEQATNIAEYYKTKVLQKLSALTVPLPMRFKANTTIQFDNLYGANSIYIILLTLEDEDEQKYVCFNFGTLESEVLDADLVDKFGTEFKMEISNDLVEKLNEMMNLNIEDYTPQQ